MNYQRRIDAVRDLMHGRGLDLLLIGQPANREYLSGFTWHDESSTVSVGWIVLSSTMGLLLTNFNHAEAAKATIRHLEVRIARARLNDLVVDVLREIEGTRIGYESDWINVSTHASLVERIGAGRSLVPADGLVEELRAVKDVDEIAALRRAIDLTDRAYTNVVGRIKPGQTERQVAWDLERELRELGADSMAFGPAVAAGPHSAIPHHEPTDYAIEPGDPMWVDLGAQINGYCGDLTRSFCLEFASDFYLETWNKVHEAEKRALAGLKEGLSGQDVDAFARDFFTSIGRADEFGHGLGHGLGLMIHEGPRVSWTSDEPMRAGMVVTIEPGLYRVGWGGVRLEDVALVRTGGAEVLSTAPKAPVVGTRW